MKTSSASRATAATVQTSQPASHGVVFGRYMLPDMTEHPCQVTNLSLDGATFITDKVPPGGQQIVAYIDDIGRVEGVTAEAEAGGFRVLFALTGARRERFLSRLTWVANKNAKTLENRRHARYEPKETSSNITLSDGRVYGCEVIDISLSGAAVKVDVVPSLGTHLMLGKMRGRVVRYLPSGIAIEFLRPLEQTQLHEQVR